jgi:enoyl-CoA hydratase/carnithine racemase
MTTFELDPQEAKRLGIVMDVFEPEELMLKVEEIAARVGKNSYITKAYIKRALNRKCGGSLPGGRALHAVYLCL